MPATSTKLRRATRAAKQAEQFHQANYIRVFGEHFPAKGGTIADTSTLGGLFDETPHAPTTTKQPKPAQYDLFADTKEG